MLAKRDEDEVLPDRDFVGGVEQEVIGQAGLNVPCHSNSPDVVIRRNESTSAYIFAHFEPS